MTPSMSGLLFTGVILLIILLIFAKNYSQFIKLNYYRQICLLSLVSLVIGIHSILHLGAESVYGFNPYNLFNLITNASF
jgi:uncharacterized integral membrane protein